MGTQFTIWKKNLYLLQEAAKGSWFNLQPHPDSDFVVVDAPKKVHAKYLELKNNLEVYSAARPKNKNSLTT